MCLARQVPAWKACPHCRVTHESCSSGLRHSKQMAHSTSATPSLEALGEGVGGPTGEGATTTPSLACWGVWCAGIAAGSTMVASSAPAALGEDVGGLSGEGATTTAATELVCWSCAGNLAGNTIVPSSESAAPDEVVGKRSGEGATTITASALAGRRASCTANSAGESMEGVDGRSDEGVATTAAMVRWGVSCAGMMASSASAAPMDDGGGRSGEGAAPIATTALVGRGASCAVDSGVEPMVAS
mmetsp:Transcript_142255/g.454697  ORF Transcript_142255/g.454697 Transcript_142255/m.454697 type:complete len:244 (+) Transcript_142255:1335-2066(+)